MQNSSSSSAWRGSAPAGQAGAGGTMPNSNAKFRSARSMPAWFHQQQQQARLASARAAPPPPPPPSDPPPLDPDYEVIEFPSQQYMNAAPPAKTNGAAGPGARRGDGKHCDLCGSSLPAVRCDQCASQIFCYSCDDMYHRHPKRTTHARKPLQQAVRPPLPPKGEAPPAPVPPPRRKGRTSRMGTPSPLDGQVNPRHSCALS